RTAGFPPRRRNIGTAAVSSARKVPSAPRRRTRTTRPPPAARPGLFGHAVSWVVVRQTHAGELPALMGIEEVAVGGARMPLGRRAGCAAQHELAAHELAVVLAERARSRAEPRVRSIGALRPLPHVAEHLRRPVGGAQR